MAFYNRFSRFFGIILLLAGDFIALFSIFQFSVLLRIAVLPRIFTSLPEHRCSPNDYIWILTVWLGILVYEEAYSRRFSTWDEVKLLWKSSLLSAVTIFTMLFLFKRGQDYSRVLILAMTLLSAILLPLIRLRIKKLLYSLGLMRRKVLIIGSGPEAEKALRSIRSEPNLGYSVVGFLDDEVPSKSKVCGLKVRRGVEAIERYIKRAGVQDVLIAKPELSRPALTRLINSIQHKAENTLYIPDICGVAVSGTELRHFFKEQTIVIEVKNNLSNPLIYLVKRTLDYTAGLAIMLVTLPLMLLISLAIKLDSRGPAILRQKRIGKRGRMFYCYKFRTMRPDAEEALKKLLESDAAAREEYAKYWKLTDDPRITRVGGFLRRTSLDELPQIINVVLGEMSLIGPRPYLTREWEYIQGESEIIHALPPGITGLWQVSGRNNHDYNFRIMMDSWYVKNWNFWLDITIFLKTLAVVLHRDGAK